MTQTPSPQRSGEVHRLIALQEEANRRLTLVYWLEQIKTTPKMAIFGAAIRLFFPILLAWWLVTSGLFVFGMLAFRLIAGR